MMQKNHPLAEKKSVRLEELLEYPFIIETPGCDNDILHLLERCGKEPKTSYSFRDDTLIMAFVKNGLGVTISQKLVMKAFANDVESRLLNREIQNYWVGICKNNELGCDEDIVGISKGDDVVFCSEESPVLWHIWHENKKIVKLWN